MLAYHKGEAPWAVEPYDDNECPASAEDAWLPSPGMRARLARCPSAARAIAHGLAVAGERTLRHGGQIPNRPDAGSGRSHLLRTARVVPAGALVVVVMMGILMAARCGRLGGPD